MRPDYFYMYTTASYVHKEQVRYMHALLTRTMAVATNGLTVAPIIRFRLIGDQVPVCSYDYYDIITVRAPARSKRELTTLSILEMTCNPFSMTASFSPSS